MCRTSTSTPMYPRPESRPLEERRRRSQVLRAVPAALAILLTAAGCVHTKTHDFSDRPRQDVWEAVVQACRQPRYRDWIVVQNEVSVDAAAQRVHVLRELKRDLVTPGLEPHREETWWRFTATVLPGTTGTVEFASPDWCIPAHFWAQADHFFAQVRMRLAEMGPVTPAPGDPMEVAAPPAPGDPGAPGHLPAMPSSEGLSPP